MERWGLALLQSAMMARMAGRDIQVPSMEDLRRQFDAALAAPPEEELEEKDPERAALVRAMGLRR